MRITLIFGAIFIGTTLYVGQTLFYFLREELPDQQRQEAADRLQEALPPAVLAENEPLDTYATRLVATMADSDVAVYDAQGVLLKSSDNSPFPPQLPAQNQILSNDEGEDRYFVPRSGLEIVLLPISGYSGAAQAIAMDVSERNILLDSISSRVLFGLLPSLALILFCGVYLSSFTRRNLKPLLYLTEEISHSNWEAKAEMPPATEFRQLGESIVSMQQQLATYDHQRRTSLARVSHELRSPLAVIQAVATASNTPMGLETERGQQIIDACVIQMDRLLDDLRYIMGGAKSTTAIRSTLMPLDLEKSLGRIVAYYDLVMRQKKVAIDIKIMEPALEISMEFARFHQLIANLIDNAIEHGRATAISIAVEPIADHQVRIAVKDNGAGIPAEIQNEIFDEFFSTAAPESGKHHGLGLAIISDIVQNYGGEISLDSKLGTGSTFYLRLPRFTEPPLVDASKSQPDIVPIEPQASPSPQVTGGPEDRPQPSMLEQAKGTA